MQINKGVEWAAHACALLASLWPDKGLSLAALADFHGVPHPYMAKQMQALAKAGLVRGGRGRSGFYSLARAPSEITLLDILQAIGGEGPMFHCTEIRQQGPCGSSPEECLAPCTIAAGFARAEAAYNATLARIDLAALNQSVFAQLDAAKIRDTAQWLGENVRTRA